MNRSHGTRIIGAGLLIAALALPGSALAKPRNHHRTAHHTVATKTSAVPQASVIVPHKYDAGGDGGDLGLPASTKVELFDPVQVAIGIGTAGMQQVNADLVAAGLPPLPVPAL